MNIFDQYLDKLRKVILDLSKKGDLILPDKLDGITAEIPPSKFKSDISTNVAMVLSKVNKKSPTDLANTLTKAIKKNLISCSEFFIESEKFTIIEFVLTISLNDLILFIFKLFFVLIIKSLIIRSIESLII